MILIYQNIEMEGDKSVKGAKLQGTSASQSILKAKKSKDDKLRLEALEDQPDNTSNPAKSDLVTKEPITTSSHREQPAKCNGSFTTKQENHHQE
jgi:hypothetical protein